MNNSLGVLETIEKCEYDTLIVPAAKDEKSLHAGTTR